MNNTILSYQFLDTTLRDGEQRPGVSFTRQAKVELALALDAWGIGIIEAGIPAMGAAERGTLDVLHGLGLRAEILVWNRLHGDDLDLCLAAGYPDLHFSVPVSDVMLKGKLGRDRRWVLDQVDRIVGQAVAAGRRVSLGAEDSSRAAPAFLAEVFRRAVGAGARRVRYADTLGLLTPERTSREIGALTAGLPVPLDFHGHNDFGLATANTLAAAQAGAGVLSCSLLGLGERAGNAALEEVFAALAVLPHPGRPADSRLAALAALCRKAAVSSCTAIPPHKPLVGAEVFSHQSGIHVDGLLKDSRTYEAWPPKTLGGRRRLRFGKHSGVAALRHLASAAGVEVDEADAREFLGALRDRMSSDSADPERLFREFVDSRRSPP